MGCLCLAHLQCLTFCRADRKCKRHFSASTAGTPPLTTPVCPPAFFAGGCPSQRWLLRAWTRLPSSLRLAARQ